MKTNSPKEVFRTLRENRQNFFETKKIPMNITVAEAIGDLERKFGEIISPDSPNFKAGVYGPIQSNYQKLMRSGKEISDIVDSHRFVNHKEKIVELHEELLKKAPAGKRISPSDGYVKGLKRRGVMVLNANSQAPTITSIPDEMIHYVEPRILSVREHARLQSFPDWYEFKGKYTSGGKLRKFEVPRYTQVGNAVPPLFAEQMGYALLEVISHGKTT